LPSCAIVIVIVHLVVRLSILVEGVIWVISIEHYILVHSVIVREIVIYCWCLIIKLADHLVLPTIESLVLLIIVLLLLLLGGLLSLIVEFT